MFMGIGGLVPEVWCQELNNYHILKSVKCLECLQSLKCLKSKVSKTAKGVEFAPYTRKVPDSKPGETSLFGAIKI